MPTLYRIAIKAGLYRKAVHVRYLHIPGDKYMNGSVFSRARYMTGIDFEILARTPLPHLGSVMFRPQTTFRSPSRFAPHPPPPPPNPLKLRQSLLAI